MKLYQPTKHRPVETCAICRQPWPCAADQADRAARQRARDAIARALEAARLIRPATPTEEKTRD